MSKKGRPKKYSGTLAEPLIIHSGFATLLENVPSEGLGEKALGELRCLQTEAREYDKQKILSGFGRLVAILSDLCDHYGINLKRPAALRDLILKLIQRHEPDLLKGSQLFSDLYGRYSLDPNSPEGDLLLAFELIVAHVVTVTVLPEVERSRIHTDDLLHFVMAVFIVSDRIGANTTKRMARQVSMILCDGEQLRQHVPGAAADRIENMMRTNGNRRRSDLSGEHAIHQTTIEKTYIPEIWDARQAYLSGRATKFQKQLVLEVFPVFDVWLSADQLE